MAYDLAKACKAGGGGPYSCTVCGRKWHLTVCRYCWSWAMAYPVRVERDNEEV